VEEVTGQALAFWVTEPGVGEIRPVPVATLAQGEVRVRTTHTGISRGTETVVFGGRVPRSEWQTMRAPFQEGDFPGPVKYGYLNVGVVEEGPDHLLGQRVFSLFPHQTEFVVPASAVTALPDDVPSDRAVLVGTVETAINALWDAGPLLGDRATVVGAGMVGCAVARLLAAFPGVEVQLVDVDASRRVTAEALGVAFARPAEARDGRDLVIHASATSLGLQLSLDLLAPEGTVIDVSWYGNRDVTVSLGGAFHTRRLAVRASQVGRVSPAMGGRRTSSERLGLAASLLRDPAFDALLTGHSPFLSLPHTMQRISTGDLPAICHVIDFTEETRCSA
jgi:threonine dehydrogenase-like Zn-dependent dehydrogenase